MVRTKNYYILKDVCRRIYIAGLGDFWFEEGEIGNDKTLQYRLLSGILLFSYVFMCALEIMAAIWGDLPEDEKNDSITLGASHMLVQLKLFSALLKKERIKEFIRMIVDICKEHENEEQLESNCTIIKINMAVYFLAVFGSVLGYIFEGIRKMRAGRHFTVVVTYWPYHEDNSFVAVSFRIFITGVLLCMVLSVIAMDVLTIASIIMYKYKLVTLRYYFEGLRVKFDENNFEGNEQYAGDQLRMGLIEGIVMHAKLIRLRNDIDYSFGTLIAIQVILSSGTAVTLLPQLALTQGLSVSAAMKIVLFIVALFFLLALYLCNAGDITYQASLLSGPIFCCGWHATPMRRDLRHLVLLACMSAQRPIVMKAFKTLELTYATFIQVVRSTYSVFALFYAQNE